MKPLTKIVFAIFMLFAVACEKEDYRPIITQTIHFDEGWSMFSTYLEIETDFPTLFGPHIDKVEFITDSRYLFQDTTVYFDLSIDKFRYYKGYEIRAHEAFELELEGRPCRPENITFHLGRSNTTSAEEGWNIIPFLRSKSLNTEIFTRSFGENLEILKDDKGKVCWPLFDVFTIDSLQPDEAYQVKCYENCEFSYPVNE